LRRAAARPGPARPAGRPAGRLAGWPAGWPAGRLAGWPAAGGRAGACARERPGPDGPGRSRVRVRVRWAGKGCDAAREPAKTSGGVAARAGAGRL